MVERSIRASSGVALLALAFGGASGCAGQPSQPASPEEPNGASEQESSADQRAEAEEDEPEATEAGSDDEAEPEEGQYEVDATPREVRYLVKPDGLQIDVAGARFRPTATVVRVGGGWGVKIEVEASSDDGKTHSLLASDEGPLAFAGTVTRGGQEKRFDDKRSGGEEQLLFPDAPVTLSRDWPGSTGQAPVRAGQELRLEVGLWGLGKSAQSRRPVKKFFLVRMKVGSRKPSALVSPPEKL